MTRTSAALTSKMALFVFALLLPSLTSATCYWQNSTLAPNDQYSIATDDVACFPNQQNSPCCGTGWSCLSDGVCYIKQGNNEFYYRGTCTDKTWGSQQCPGWCFAQNNSTSVPMSKCKKSTGEDWYCCQNDPNCNCDTGKNAIKLGATQPVTATVIGSTSWPGYQSTGTPVTAGNIATSTFASAQSTSAATNTIGTGTAAAATTTGSPTSSASTSASSSGSTNTTALAAGLGAGLGLAVALVGVVAFFFVRRSRKRRATEAASLYKQLPTSSSPADNATPFGTSKGLATPRPGDGYYATSAVNEKDGVQAFKTQELDASGHIGAYASTQKHGYSYAGQENAVEMDAPSNPKPTSNMRNQERAELA